MSDFEGKAMYIKLEREIYTNLKNNLEKKKLNNRWFHICQRF